MRPFIHLSALASPFFGLAMLVPGAAGALEADTSGADGAKLGAPVQLAQVQAAQAQAAQDSAELVGRPGKPLALGLPEPAAGSEARFIMVRGLPTGFRLSQGFPVKQSWFLSTTEAKALQLLPPPAFSGDLVLEILYFKDSKEAPLTSLVRTVVIRPETATEPGHVSASATPAPAPATPAAPRPIRKIQLTAERETETLRRGEEAMKRGDIAAARLLFEDLAAMGSAKGAFAMAQSYDADYLRTVFIQGGLQPDPANAKAWYERAARLGSNEAQTALTALEGRSH